MPLIQLKSEALLNRCLRNRKLKTSSNVRNFNICMAQVSFKYSKVLYTNVQKFIDEHLKISVFMTTNDICVP